VHSSYRLCRSNEHNITTNAVFRRGAALDNCWAFIDGTARPICRPNLNQEEYCSGHKRHHCVKYQSLLCPDGIIVNLYGSVAGRRHDEGILRESGPYEQMQEKLSTFVNGQRFKIYGDSVYLLLLLFFPIVILVYMVVRHLNILRLRHYN
jgi:hypothetical protein